MPLSVYICIHASRSITVACMQCLRRLAATLETPSVWIPRKPGTVRGVCFYTSWMLTYGSIYACLLQVRVPAEVVERCVLSKTFKMETTQTQDFACVSEGVYKLKASNAGGRGVTIDDGVAGPQPTQDGRITLDDFEQGRVKGPAPPKDREDFFTKVRIIYSTGAQTRHN